LSPESVVAVDTVPELPQRIRGDGIPLAAFYEALSEQMAALVREAARL
jgi:hypothetical protein